MQLDVFPVTLLSAQFISPRVKHFVFETRRELPFQYIPGQFITIHFDYEGKKLKRSYSIANPPAGDNRIEWAAGHVEDGPGTKLLFGLNPGDTINITGPFGRLILKDPPPKRYLLVATSTGITPYRAMFPKLTDLLKASADFNVVILFGIQTHADILYAEDFRAFAAAFPNQVTLRIYLSRPDAPLAHDEYAGYVQTAFPSLQLSPADDQVYLCGNPGMIDNAFEALKTAGFSMQHIVREKYISSGRP